MNKMPAFSFAVLTACVMILLSCSRKNPQDDQKANDADEEWEGMEEFHMVMAESFHPYKDSSDLAPAKANAASLAEAAKKWKNARLPGKVDNEEVKSKMEKLQHDAEVFQETVNAGNEKAIGQSLTDLHQLFHELQESWYGGNHGDHGQH